MLFAFYQGLLAGFACRSCSVASSHHGILDGSVSTEGWSSPAWARRGSCSCPLPWSFLFSYFCVFSARRHCRAALTAVSSAFYSLRPTSLGGQSNGSNQLQPWVGGRGMGWPLVPPLGLDTVGGALCSRRGCVWGVGAAAGACNGKGLYPCVLLPCRSSARRARCH